MTPYSNMTIWALEQERDKINAELQARYLVRGDRLQPQAEALALLRELNDELKIPGWLQPRVDAVLNRAEEKT